MKLSSLKSKVLLAFWSLSSIAYGQLSITPYDQLPSLYESNKPSYSKGYSEWAQMLYMESVNYNEL